MLKLDNKGWGIATMIGFICVFVIFLLVVGFLVWNWNRKVTSPNSDSLINNIVLNYNIVK